MRRALVLGGGGITGIAWEIGVLAGLARAGVDLGTADLVIGTSAGAVVGSLLAGGTGPEEAVAFAGDDTPEEFALEIDMTLVAQAFGVIADRGLDPRTARVRLGELALAAPVGDPEKQVTRFAGLLPAGGWPRRPRLVVTAVDARTGEPVAWDADDGVALPRAVAASCAVPCVFPPVEVDGRRYLDGGVRSVTNADLAFGAEVVVVVAPLLGIFGGSPEVELRKVGPVRSTVVAPDAAARMALGPNVLDDSRRRDALRAGLEQGSRLAEAVGPVWD